MRYIKAFIISFFLFLVSLLNAQDKLIEIHYASSVFELTGDQEMFIRKSLDSLSQNEIDYLTIEGFTDFDASAKFNYELSQKRVDTVSAFILNQIDATLSIRRTYHGESIQLNRDTSDVRKKENRRVLISVYLIAKQEEIESISIPDELLEVVNKDSSTLKNIENNSIDDIQRLPKPIDYYTYTSNNDIQFTVKKDTSGNYPSFDVKESVSQKDMVDQGFHTMTTDNGILESYYMVNVKSDELKPQDTLWIRVPASVMNGQEGDIGWYEQSQKTGGWRLVNKDVSKNYHDSCDCYIFPESGKKWGLGISFNLDRPLRGGNELVIAHKARGLKKEKFLGLFPSYIYAHPEFYFIFNGVNSRIFPTKIRRNKVVFSRLPDTLSGRLISKVRLGYEMNISQEQVKLEYENGKKKTKVFIPKLPYKPEKEFDLVDYELSSGFPKKLR